MEKNRIKESVKERFLQYVAFDTQSCSSSESFPSTDKQLVLLSHLATQMREMGMSDVVEDKYGYVMGRIPATKGCESARVIGFLAHVDTSPDVSGEGVTARVWSNYDGGDMVLNGNCVISAKDYPALTNLIGHDIITSDGTTLLGADDKAGVAEIMTAAEILLQDPTIAHGEIRIGFTPDEEIGRGVDFFDVKSFGADLAYTLDGGMEGELEYENFNAASACVEICGHNHHPGDAKGHMINALEIAHELHAMLPPAERPQYTSGYDGFFHLMEVSGTVDGASAEYIIRDHSDELFERRKVAMWSAVDFLNKRYGEGTIKLTLKDQYYNMRKMVEPHIQMVELAEEAMRMAGVAPLIKPIRGGTDGSRLSFMGLPCPNLFTGGGNFHSRHEYCSLTTMVRAVDVIVNIAQLWAR